MTNSNEMTPTKALEVFEELQTRYEQAVDHAVAYKRMYHELQDMLIAEQELTLKQRCIMKRQREIIRKLEASLGIDQDL